MKKISVFSILNMKILIWLALLGLLALCAILAYFSIFSYYWLIIPILLIIFAAYDSFYQTKHALLHNFPLLGRFRYIFEAVRPEFRQYFFEGELDGKPFNRRQRSIVYQRAKNEKQTISFGMQDDPERIGYEWAAHSMYTRKAKIEDFRVNVGNDQCSQPYNLSVLNISAMSYGALSSAAIRALNLGAKFENFAHNTGEGGISEFHLSGGDLIWQIGTGYFGCRDDNGKFSPELFKEKANLPNVKMIEIKVSQGAKPGHGGLLPAEKNTPQIAKIRNIEPYTEVHSPTSHSAFSNAVEFLQFVKQLRSLSGGKPIGFKICIGRKDEFIEILDAMLEHKIIPDFIVVDGAEGGTGAAPLEFIDSLGMALYDSLAFVTVELKKRNLKKDITVIASGKIITGFDIAKAIALGANACYSARGMMFALGCIQALHCDSGKCPVGIATQSQKLYKGLDITDKSVRVANFHRNTLKALAEFIGACGVDKLSEVRPDFFFKRTEYNQNESFQEMYFKRRNNIN